MTDAVAYYRTSPGTNEDGTSIPGQKQDVDDYASEHNIKIVEEFEDEGVSGQKTAPLERQGFYRLKEYVLNEDVNLILVRRTHRIGRQVKDVIGIQDTLRWLHEERFRTTQEYEIRDVTGKTLDYEIDRTDEANPVEQFSEMLPDFFNLLVGSMKAAQTSADTQAALQNKKERDQPVGRNPFGLTTDKQVFVDQETATMYLPGEEWDSAMWVIKTYLDASAGPDSDESPSAWSTGKDLGFSSPSKKVKRIWESFDKYHRAYENLRTLTGERDVTEDAEDWFHEPEWYLEHYDWDNKGDLTIRD